MERRKFLGAVGCLMALGAAPGVLRAQAALPVKPYRRARLMDRQNRPLKASALAVGQDFLFFYPFVGTPAFLLNLGIHISPQRLHTADDVPYDWPGGVGPDGSIVAYTAVCSHQLTRPSPAESSINFRPGTGKDAGQAGRVVCCAHNSVYNPAAGAEVVQGPAKHPLTTVVLEYDSGADALHAVGTAGQEVFAEYFKAYGAELRSEFGPGVARQEAGEACPVIPCADYSQQQVLCSP